MNTEKAKDAVKSFIAENRDQLMTALVHQGQQRQIVQITTSKLTPLHDYYFIGISCPRARTYSEPGVRTVPNPKGWTDYRMLIEVYDEASIQDGDDEAYETMTGDFDRFVDRIEALLRGVPYKTGIGETRLNLKKAAGGGENDRVISRADLSGTWKDTESTNVAWLYAQLEFTLTEQCDDATSLYR